MPTFPLPTTPQRNEKLVGADLRVRPLPNASHPSHPSYRFHPYHSPLTTHHSPLTPSKNHLDIQASGRLKWGVPGRKIPPQNVLLISYRFIPTKRPKLAQEEFNFEAEFSLLDIGATSSLIRTGSVRPTVLAFSQNAAVEAVTLTWEDSTAIPRAFEEARRYVRDLEPAAYAVIAHVTKYNGTLDYHLPSRTPAPLVNDFLALSMVAKDGNTRAVTYPIRHSEGKLSLGMPSVTDSETTDWRPLGDLWVNPFCVGDVARFKLRERAVDPATPLWNAIVELTRLRIHDDQSNADEYMSFLDDLRNGVFLVAGRVDSDPSKVQLRPRTSFNPLGTLTVDASRLVLGETLVPDVEQVTA
jgi:hypothetical protein